MVGGHLVKSSAHTPSPGNQLNRSQDRDSSQKEGLHLVVDTGLAAHQNKAPKGLAKFSFSLL